MRSQRAIGVELGTNYSCVAVWHTGDVEMIPDDNNNNNNQTTPSYVVFKDSEGLIGEAAKIQGAINPPNTSTIFDGNHRRLIEGRFDDLTLQDDMIMKHWPFKVTNVRTKLSDSDKQQKVADKCKEVLAWLNKN